MAYQLHTAQISTSVIDGYSGNWKNNFLKRRFSNEEEVIQSLLNFLQTMPEKRFRNELQMLPSHRLAVIAAKSDYLTD